jgi:DNA-binding response OmpR family regulator
VAGSASLDQSPMVGRKVLVVDDEEPILDALAYGLRKEGLRVYLAANAEACMRSFRENQPDLIVLDVMLPSASGFEICKKIRASSDVPIILLTARAEEQYKLKGLELGADDYVTKPFSVRELIARIRAVLRRQTANTASEPLISGAISVDPARHEATINERPMILSPKEFSLLSFFMSHPGIAFARQTLLDRVWGIDAYVEERTVDVHVRWLRTKIERDPADPKILVTVRGVGYKFVGEAS